MLTLLAVLFLPLGDWAAGTVAVEEVTLLETRGLDKMLQFFLNSMVASCDTICLSIVFLEGELVPRSIFGTLEGDKDCETGFSDGFGVVTAVLAIGILPLLDFSSTNGIVLPLKIKLVAPVDLIMGAADEPGDNGLGLATITPAKVVDA